MTNINRVRKGDPITADAWNEVVDKVNGQIDVSLRRGKRRARGVKGEEIYVCSSTAVTQDGGLELTFIKIRAEKVVEDDNV